MHRLWISLLSIVASSSAFRLPASPPPKGSSIDSDCSTKNKKQPGFLRLISAWYGIGSSTLGIMTPRGPVGHVLESPACGFRTPQKLDLPHSTVGETGHMVWGGVASP